MNAPALMPASNDWLLRRWRPVLRFRIGAGDHASLDQLPNPEDFPSEYLTDDDSAPWALREVLGVAVLKLYRPWVERRLAGTVLDSAGGWLVDLASSGYDFSYLAPLGRVVELALCEPDCLPALVARIDALDNDKLHGMAMAAVQGLPVPDVFEGLL